MVAAEASLRKKKLLGVFVFLSLSFIPYVVGAQGGAKVGVEIRGRSEYWDTFLDAQAYDNPYGFTLIRARSFIEYSYGSVLAHAALQGASAIGLPDNAFIGPGKSYYDLNKRANPHGFSLLHLYLKAKIDKFDIIVGRVPFREGAEVVYEDKKFNFLKERCISERLVGNLDWSNVGRRFDGGSIGLDLGKTYVNLFGGRALSGGVDFVSPHVPMNIVAGGASFVLKKELVRNTEIRLFNIFYNDWRDFVKKTYNKPIFLNSPGANLVSIQKLGPGEIDFALWGAYQLGNFGDKKQQAFAFAFETGYEFVDVFLTPWIRFGFTHASGDDNPNDNINRRFFNMIPSNHKYYGYLDLFALSNLQDTRIHLLLTYDFLRFETGFHIMRLASASDRWVLGSGAATKDRLGFSEIKYTGKDVGNELDLTLYVNPTKWFSFLAGYSVLFGSEKLKEVFPQKKNISWLYSQATISIR